MVEALSLGQVWLEGTLFQVAGVDLFSTFLDFFFVLATSIEQELVVRNLFVVESTVHFVDDFLRVFADLWLMAVVLRVTLQSLAESLVLEVSAVPGHQYIMLLDGFLLSVVDGDWSKVLIQEFKVLFSQVHPLLSLSQFLESKNSFEVHFEIHGPDTFIAHEILPHLDV